MVAADAVEGSLRRAASSLCGTETTIRTECVVDQRGSEVTKTAFGDHCPLGGVFIDAQRQWQLRHFQNHFNYGFEILERIDQPWQQRARWFKQQEELIDHSEQPLEQ